MLNIEDLGDIYKNLDDKSHAILAKEIYNYYTNSKDKDSSKSKGSKEIIVNEYLFDKGWFYDKELAYYFKSIGKYLLRKGSDAVVVTPEEFSIDTYQDSLNQKRFVTITIPKIVQTESWNFVYGNNYLGFSNRARIYLSLKKEDSSIKFIDTIAEILNEKGIPFMLKYERVFSVRNENCVVYFNKMQYFLVFTIIANCCQGFADYLRVPNFHFVKTFKLYESVAFAEDTDSNESFGELRSNVIAEIMGKEGFEMSNLEKELSEYGYNTKKFYLNPNTDFPYSFKPFSCGGLGKDYLIKGLDENLLLIQKIVYLIVKNMLVYEEGENLYFQLPEFVSVGDDSSRNEFYRLCNSKEKEEIFSFVISYLELLKYRKLMQDYYIFDFINYIIESFDGGIKTSFIKRLDALSDKFGGGHIDKMADIKFLEELSVTDEKWNDKLENIKRNFKHRGVVSYMPNDEFVVSYQNYGYTYIAMQLMKLVYKESKLD